jgi:hypothetical protein
VERCYRAYVRDPDVDAGELVVAIRTARNIAQSDNLDANVREVMNSYLAAVESVVDSRTDLKGKVDDYITFVCDAETTILSRHAVDNSK